jgi:hypothetical protein
LHPCQAEALTDQIPGTATIVSSLTISAILAFNGQQPGANLARGILLFLDTGQFNPTLTA